MVFNLGELDFECRLKWFFQPRQVTGMAVADYYTQFCDWKEEMITLSISAEEDDFIDEFIGNLRWDIRSRVVSKWRSFIHKLSDALYNAKWEESMILIEKNLDLNPESKSVLPPMNPHPDGTIGDDTMEEAIAIKRDAWAQHELVPAPIRESVDEDLDGEGTVQGSANGPFKAYDEAATQLQLDVDPSKIGTSNGEPTDESTDPSFTCLKSFSGKFCSFSMIKEVECHLLKAGVALINKAEEIFPAKTEAVVVAYQVLDEMTKSESAGMGSSAGVKNIKIAGRSHSSMIQNLEITRHMLDGMPKLFSVGPNADMDGNKDHVLSLNYILQIFDHKSCSLIDDGIIYSFDPGGISLLLLFPLLDFYCIDELLTNKEQPIIQKIVDKMQASGKSDRDDWRTELPREGLGFGVLELLKEEKQKDVAWQGKCSCTVYIGGSEHEGHFSLINEACSMFSHTNPLHMDVFKSVVAMTAALLGSKEKSVEGHICGNMTSGGTESILMAVKASRDYMKAKKGISKPEMIIPVSAHSAYDKAAQYFNIKLWRVPVNREFQADVKAIKRHINRNTIMIVGSAPGFPHGIIDPIEELGELACSYGICFHVDLCLGGFVLPFARKLGYPVPPYDFSVNGVTSISVDVHKYGLAPKGTSVVLYRNHDLRKHQFVAVTEWSGGLYVSPTVAGSRPGSLIAGAWAAMVSLGFEGYMENTRIIMEASKRITKGVQEIPELFIIGRPDMTIVAFGSKIVDIFEVNDIMSSKGWHLNALQRPNSLHICATLQHAPVIDDFLKDLKDSVQTVKQNPGPVSGGLAPIYGAAGKMPDRAIVEDLLIDFMDSSC